MSLPEALERAASALPERADAIRPANGDPHALLGALDPPGAAAVLGWLLVHEAEAAAELVDEWLDDARGAEALAAIDEASLPKAGRKVLRRARHRLRSRGVAVETPTPSEPVVATLPRVEEPLRGAFVSNVDPRGAALVYLVEPHPSGGARIFEVVVDGVRGVVAFDVYSASRGGARRFMRDLSRRSRFAVVEVDAAEARALVAAAVRAQPADRPLPRGFEEWRARLTAGDGPLPAARVRDALPEADAPGRRFAAAELVRHGEIGPWPPPPDRLHEVAELVKERAEGGRIIISGARKREQVADAVDRAAAAVFDEAFAAVTADRFEHAAFVLWSKGRDDDARACLAAASAFREGDLEENPAARAMLEVVLAPVLAGGEPAGEAPEEEAGPDDEEPRLLVEP